MRSCCTVVFSRCTAEPPACATVGYRSRPWPRPQQHFAYAKAADIVDMAAAYTAGIVQNHPFLDGNKRTGFVVGILFLELNGYRFAASEEDAAQAVINLAAGTLNEAGYSGFLRDNVAPGKKRT